jgi:hypothetical protein
MTVRRTSETAVAAKDKQLFLNVAAGSMVVIKSLSLACACVVKQQEFRQFICTLSLACVVTRRDNTDFTDAIKRVVSRARSYQFAQVLELMQQNEQKEQFFMVIRNSRTCS